MNETIGNIMSRRSVRKYKKQQLLKQELDNILVCGINAPSALNLQPWKIRVVQSAEILNKINSDFVEWANGKKLKGSAARASEQGFSVFHNAPTLVVVACDNNNHYSRGDCGNLAQNIMLAAESLNIGSCVIGNVANIINSSDFLKKTLEISGDFEVVFGIALGYKDEAPPVKPKDSNKIVWIK